MVTEDCEKWRKEPLINPLTNRRILVNGPTYKKLERNCKPKSPQVKISAQNSKFSQIDCMTWNKDRSKNPLTGRKIDSNAKKGVYAQLMKLCNNPIPDRKTTNSIKINSHGNSRVNKNLDNDRNKLIDAVKKAIKPILHKGDTTEARIQFANIMNKYIKDLKPCLEEKQGKLYLYDKHRNPVIFFDKQIGSESNYGVAYMNMGKGFGKLLKFSCKIMASNVPEHKQEIEILKKMSNLVTMKISPNMPVIYNSMKCNKKCESDICPSNVKQNGYYIVLNELANSDIQNWFKQSYKQEVYESIIMQLMFSIYSFHCLGYSHNDCHLGNFLIHHIKPGGCWRYKVGKHDVYVPNHGYQLVLWDPGFARNIKYFHFSDDYYRAFVLIYNIMDYKKYIDMKLKPLPKELVDTGLIPLLNTISMSRKPEGGAMEDVIIRLKTNVIKLNSIVIDDVPPTHLLNVNPYVFPK